MHLFHLMQAILFFISQCLMLFVHLVLDTRHHFLISCVVHFLQNVLKRLGSLLMDFAKLGGKLVVLLWLMDGLIEREGRSSTSWSTVPKVLSFSSQLMSLIAPKLEIFCL